MTLAIFTRPLSPYNFLTNLSGLFKARSSILSSVEAGPTRPGVETMSLTVFLALCILGLDFMIYALFKLLYGDRRSVIARRVAAQREAARAEASGLFLVPAKKTVPSHLEPDRSTGARVSSTSPGKLLARHSYTTRIA